MPSEQELLDQIAQIVESIVQKKVDPDTKLIETGLVDSLSAVDIALDVEAKLNCSIPDTEIADRMQTVRTLAAYVLSKQK